MFILTKKNRFPEFEVDTNIGIYSTLDKALDKVNFKECNGKSFFHKGEFISWCCPEIKVKMKDGTGKGKHIDVYVSYTVTYFELDK